MSDYTTRKGKIARLPKSIRDEVNRRLLDNKPASEILPWLNADATVRSILDEHFSGDDINDQNLSAWRTGGFATWMQQQDEITRIREKSRHALDLVKAGGHNITDGMAAIIAGDLLEEIEQAEGEDKETVMRNFFALRAADHVRQSLELQHKKLALEEKKHGLNLKKFMMLTVKKFMEWAGEPRAQNILNSGKPKEVQMDLLHELIWGKAPAEGGGDE